jgi:hypothetical protein
LDQFLCAIAGALAEAEEAGKNRFTTKTPSTPRIAAREAQFFLVSFVPWW